MNDTDGRKLAKLENETENQDRRIASLEKNQRWGVLALIGLMLKGAFDFIKGGIQ